MFSEMLTSLKIMIVFLKEKTQIRTRKMSRSWPREKKRKKCCRKSKKAYASL